MTNVYLNIDDVCGLPAFAEAKAKSDRIKAKIAKQNNTYDTGGEDVAAHEYLCDYPNSELHERMRWKVICEQLSGGSFAVFTTLYFETDIIELFEYMAVRNAIYATTD